MEKIPVFLLCMLFLIQSSVGKTQPPLPPFISAVSNADSAKKPVTGPPGKPKPYKEVITDKAITTKGMIILHRIDEKYYFEIPGDMFGRDILVVARFSKGPAEIRGKNPAYAGDQVNSNTLRFEKSPHNKVYVKRTSFLETSSDSTVGMYRNVMNSNIQPIVAAFDVKAWAPDTAGAVIDMTDYLNGDNEYLFFSAEEKKELGIGSIQADRSYILGARTYPNNLEVKTVKTYMYSPRGGAILSAPSRPVTFEMNTSFVLLPEKPMQPRYFDDRVGYFTTDNITDFDANPQGIDRYNFIARYRLEPREEEIEKYKRGELVEPKKQIVYYIDPTTPKKWVPYLIQGVNDWQVAFEKAGFKNAIVAKPAPSYAEDSTFSLDDARHSAIIYKPSDIANASGPHIHDPRSGEIMESHINWYHNVMSLVRNWYMVQAGAVDPRARKLEFDDELMGQLIRFVSSHEVGHSLGLRHNFGSSASVPTEKLRDRAWVEANGHTPSIMDYARFNYVAQPEDHISEKGLFPRIGDYDTWAIEWGYRWYPEVKNAGEEVALLNKITIERLQNPRLWWGDGESLINATDPRSQTEDLGDNAMIAGNYGIKNLKRILANLPQYTYRPDKGYDDLGMMYMQVVNQFGRYVGHVAKNIGGLERTPRRVEQSGSVYQFTGRAKQQEAMQWLKAHVFTTPYWILQKDYAALGARRPLSVLFEVQKSSLNVLLTARTLANLAAAEAEEGKKTYTATEMLNDLRKTIFSELPAHRPIDSYRRQLQKIYVERLIALNSPSGFDELLSMLVAGDLSSGDVLSLVKGQLRKVADEARQAARSYAEGVSKDHLLDIEHRVKLALEGKKNDAKMSLF